MFGAEDDNDFSASHGPSRLSNLFGAADEGQFVPNDTLKYTAPKQPRKQTISQADSPDRRPPGSGSTAGTTATPSGVVFACAVHCYKFTNGQYASQGRVGAALLANHDKAEYRILLYISQQKPIANANLHSAFTFTVQPNRYATFYDDNRQTFSLMFDSDDDLSKFSKEVAIAKANMMSGQIQAVVSQDLVAGEGDEVGSGDTAEVRYTGWLFTGNTVGKEFDSNAKSEKLFRLRIGKGSVIKGWEQGMLGMKKGCRRLLIIPPHLAYGDTGVPSRIPPNSTLVFDVALVKVKFSSMAASKDDGNLPAATQQPIQQQQTQQQQTQQQQMPQTQHQQSPAPVAVSQHDGFSLEPNTESIKGRTQSFTEHLSQGQVAAQKSSDKASLLTRMAKLGTPMLPVAGIAGHSTMALSVEDTHVATGLDHVPEYGCPTPAVDNTHGSYHSAGSSSTEQTVAASQPLRTTAHAMASDVSGGSQVQTPQHSHQPPATTYGSQSVPQQQSLPPSRMPTPPPAAAAITAMLPQTALNLHQLQQLQQMGVYPPALDGSFLSQQASFYDMMAAGMMGGRQGMPAPLLSIATPYPGMPAAATNPLQQLAMWGDSKRGAAPTTPVGQAGSVNSRFVDMPRDAQLAFDPASAAGSVQRLSEKMDSLLDKVDTLHDAIAPSQSTMETAILVQNIRRIAEENEKFKKDAVEKNAKIETQNLKISELLQQNQRAVEQSNEMLEQRNDTYKATATQSQARVLQLEQEKIRLGDELSALASQLSQVQIQVAALKKREGDLAKDVASLSNSFGASQDELIAANQQVSEKSAQLLDQSQRFKDEKRCRREAENKVIELTEEVSDLRSSHDTLQKTLTDRKQKVAEERKSLVAELEELRARHQDELSSLKVLLQKQSAVSEQEIAQVEQLNVSWKHKFEDFAAAEKRKHQAEVATLQEDMEQLKSEVANLQDTNKQLKVRLGNLAALQQEKEALTTSNDALSGQLQARIDEIQTLANGRLSLEAQLKEKVADYENMSIQLGKQAAMAQDTQTAASSWKEKYDKLRSQASDMKALYENEVSKLRSAVADLDANLTTQKLEASGNVDRQAALDKVKSVMNIVFQSLKSQINVAEQYDGSSVLQMALTIIKRETLRLTESAENSDVSSEGGESDDEDDMENSSEVEESATDDEATEEVLSRENERNQEVPETSDTDEVEAGVNTKESNLNEHNSQDRPEENSQEQAHSMEGDQDHGIHTIPAGKEAELGDHQRPTTLEGGSLRSEVENLLTDNQGDVNEERVPLGDKESSDNSNEGSDILYESA